MEEERWTEESLSFLGSLFLNKSHSCSQQYVSLKFIITN